MDKTEENRMRRLANLRPFTSENQPKNRPSRKGIPNRATVFKDLLEMRVDVADPETGTKKKVTLYEAAALGQIKSAMTGNTPAWKEIQDTLHGKQNNVNFNLTADELKNLTDAELDDLITRLSR